jgi:CheY-like chemotaxis protein
LIADDNVDSAELLARLLVMLGHQTLIVHDGLEAVAAAKSFRPDAALLDIGMPRLNGYEVARRIRCDPACGSMKLIAMTGWGQEEDKRRAMEAGFDHHLTKPMEISAIEQILSTTPAQD